MTIYRIHPDRMRYQLMTISSAEVIKKLGQAHPFHIDPTPKAYASVWQSLEVAFYDSTSGKHDTALPDITVDQGRLFLNEKAYEAVSQLIAQDGEILPVTFGWKDGAIFNPLKTADAFDALDTKLSTKNDWGDLQSLAFIEERIIGMNIFRCEFEGYNGVFCGAAFKNAVETAGLKGISFSPDLANIFPDDPTSNTPATH